MAKKKELEAKIKALQEEKSRLENSKGFIESVKDKIIPRNEDTVPEKDGKIPEEYVDELVAENEQIIEESKEVQKPDTVEEVQEKEAPKEEAPKEEAPKEEAPKEEIPKKKVSKKEAPKKEEARIAFKQIRDGYTPDGPGKAYKYWDFEHRFYCLTTDLWAAMQAGGDTWLPVWVWYVNGQIDHLMDRAEIQRYLP